LFILCRMMFYLLLPCLSALHLPAAVYRGRAGWLPALVARSRRRVDVGRQGDAPACRSPAVVAHSRFHTSPACGQSVHCWSLIHRSVVVQSINDARFPSFRCRPSVAVSPFCRCKIPLFCKNYVRKFRSVNLQP